MATRANSFFLSDTDQDQSWGTDVRKLTESVGPLLSTTICQHPNAAGTTQITLDPYTSRNTQGDNRDVYGWAINEAGADGMESTSARKRRIKAGNWTFVMRVGLPQAGTLTGTLTATFSARVYRVGPAPTFTRTLLFTTAFSDSVQSTGISGAVTGTCTAGHTAPEIVLEAGETIHVGFLSQVVQVAGSLGATVAGNATWHTGTQGGQQIFFNPPDLDTITEMVGAVAGVATVEGLSGSVLPVRGTVTGTGVALANLGAIKGVSGAADGAATVEGKLASIKGMSGDIQGVGAADAKMASVKGMTGTVEVGAGGPAPIRPIFVFDD